MSEHSSKVKAEAISIEIGPAAFASASLLANGSLGLAFLTGREAEIIDRSENLENETRTKKRNVIIEAVIPIKYDKKKTLDLLKELEKLPKTLKPVGLIRFRQENSDWFHDPSFADKRFCNQLNDEMSGGFVYGVIQRYDLTNRLVCYIFDGCNFFPVEPKISTLSDGFPEPIPSATLGKSSDIMAEVLSGSGFSFEADLESINIVLENLERKLANMMGEKMEALAEQDSLMEELVSLQEKVINPNQMNSARTNESDSSNVTLETLMSAETSLTPLLKKARGTNESTPKGKNSTPKQEVQRSTLEQEVQRSMPEVARSKLSRQRQSTSSASPRDTPNKKMKSASSGLRTSRFVDSDTESAMEAMDTKDEASIDPLKVHDEEEFSLTEDSRDSPTI